MPQIVEGIKALLELFRLVSGLLSLYAQARREGWLQEGREVAKAIQEAKTDEERKALAKRLSSVISGMP
jgi:hypothetical protein